MITSEVLIDNLLMLGIHVTKNLDWAINNSQ